MTLQVSLSQPVKLELVDEEIIALAGCDLGFIMPGKPPQVLQVEQNSDMSAHSIRTDDVLVGVDGRDTRSLAKDELEKLLRTASKLSFERPGGVDVETKPVIPETSRATAAGASEAPPPPASAGCAAAAAPPAAAAAAATGAAAAPPPAAAAQPQPAVAQPAAASAPPAAAAAPPPEQQAPAAGLAQTGSGDVVAVKLRTGMKVRLIGFQSREMNGQRGRLGKYSEKQGCWQVFLESTSASKAVRPPNLEYIEDGDADMGGADGKDAAAGKAAAAATGDAAALLAASPLVAAMAAAMRGVVPAPQIPQWDGPGPPPGPEWMEDVVPQDDDRESWVELLRDAYVHQLRADAEHPEPPPFHRANHFAASVPPNLGRTLPEGKYPTQALNFQLQMLFRARTGEYNTMPTTSPYGYGGYGSYGGYGNQGFWAPGGKRSFGGKGGFGGGYGPARRPQWIPSLPGGGGPHHVGRVVAEAGGGGGCGGGGPPLSVPQLSVPQVVPPPPPPVVPT